MMSVKKYIVASLIAGCVASAGALANENATVDPMKSAAWPNIQKNLFGDREVIYDSKNEVLEMYIPASAEDASTVPIIVRAKHFQTDKSWIKKIWLIADKNPSPVGGTFQFYRQSGLANVETRIRVEEYTHIRAVAEDNEGKLIMAARWIRAAGGCSSAKGGDGDEAAIGKVKFKIEDDVIANQPNKVQVMIAHPNHSGMALDALTQTRADPYYVKHVEVSYQGKPVMTADVDFSISQNPNFRFYFTLENKGGELKAEFVDTKDLTYKQTLAIVPGKVAAQ